MSLLKKIFRSDDGKPVLISFFLWRDSCSRLIGDFNDKHLPTCKMLILVFEDKDGNKGILTSDGLDDARAAGMLLQAAHKVSQDNGQ